MYVGESIRINVKVGKMWSGLVWLKWRDLVLNLSICNRLGIS